MRCPVPGQQNTVVSQQGIPAVIDFTFRDRAGNPMDLSRWFKKKCQTLPENKLVPLPTVTLDEALPDTLVPLPEVEASSHCAGCVE